MDSVCEYGRICLGRSHRLGFQLSKFNVHEEKDYEHKYAGDLSQCILLGEGLAFASKYYDTIPSSRSRNA